MVRENVQKKTIFVGKCPKLSVRAKFLHATNQCLGLPISPVSAGLSNASFSQKLLYVHENDWLPKVANLAN